jgi:hypothetical protein
MLSRREQRTARRRDLDGSGPALPGRVIGRYPGMVGGFALLGEVLLTGVLVTVASLPLVTLPASLVAGSAHLRRYLRAESTDLGAFVGDFLAALRRGWAVGLATLLAVGLLLLDLDLAASGALPGGQIVAIVGWLGLAVLAVVIGTAAAAWSARTGWRVALLRTQRIVRRDPAGALYLLAAFGLVGVCTWALAPLLVPALGCLVLAIVAIPERRASRAA